MKLMLFSIVFMAVLGGIALSSLVLATSDCAAAAEPPDETEYVSCMIDKPVVTMVGDEILVNCTKSTRENGRWVRRPMNRALVYVTGYDPMDYVVVEYYQAQTGSDGTFVFKPNVAALYGIEVGRKVIANLTIIENPVLSAGTFVDSGPTGGATAPAEAPEEPEPKPVAKPNVECDAPVMEFAIGKKMDNKKADASGLMVVLARLLVS